MSITLRIIGPSSQKPGVEAEKTFVSGGTIGRAGSCDWVLPDPERFISSHHATLEQRGDEYFLTDTSINGTFLNNAEQPIGHGSSQPLHDGDRIQIGEYEIVAEVREHPSQPSQWPLDEAVTPTPQAPSPVASDLLGGSGSVDPLDHIGGRTPPPPPPTRPSPLEEPAGYGSFVPPGVRRDPAFERPPAEPPVPPPVPPPLPPSEPPPGPPPAPSAQTGAAIPEDWDKTTMPTPPAPEPSADVTPTPRPPEPPPSYPPQPHDPFGAAQPSAEPAQPAWPSEEPLAPPPQEQAAVPPQMPRQAQPPPPPQPAPQAAPPAQPSYAPGGGVAELLEAAGLDAASARALASPQTAQMLGYALRIVLKGTMEVLSARADIKSQFRVPMTQIHAGENNPLKFCVDEVDALHRLLDPDRHGFMGPVEALDEAFNDVKAHQLAMMAGMRAAFDQLMNRFNPESLQVEFDHELRRSAFFQPLNKSKYWEMLIDFHKEISADSDANFARLFGDEFARAYEEQMELLSRRQGS